MFGKLSELGRDLTFRTNASPAADRIEIDAKFACCRQDRRADSKPATFARGSEDDKRVGHGFSDP